MDEQKSDSKIRHINANDFERQRRKSSTKRRRNRLFSDKDNFDTSTEQEDNTQSNIDNHDSSNHINTATQHENNEEIQNTEDEINNSALENILHEQQNEPSEEDLSSTAQDDTAIQHNTDDGDVTEDNEDIEKPPPLTPEELREQKRRQRRKRQKTIQYIVITALILIIILFLLYMFTPISRIANVTIKGNHNVSTSEINKQLNANSGERMYTFSNSKAKAKLKDNPLIKNVDIQKHLPNTLSVTIEENQVVGMIKDKDDYIPILEGNTELKNYKGQLTDRGPIIEGFKGDKKQEIVHALAEMSPKIRSMIAEVTYEPQKNKQNRIKLYTKDDMQVIGNIKTIADKMKYYPQMSQSLSRDQSGNLTTDGYIDLSVGASFIPYKNQEAQQSQTEQDVTKNSQQENEAKSELQSVLNKINEQSKKNN
ncbi:cell division protein FtsQ/DivIB [Staphylococcus lugdunensis]|uniref:cell division protein FtsQ/DivIB n=1 Tax=Staphylococcus lugdunensis TaxID=28035 RepID=UPI001F4D34D9|nr:FtsQ-type POTRA domain-containing protein [Staphylococcus lugdunensis]MCH8641663.1 FtsQ-type POTRA domain-containing protein [Staphylococcus lugdunensis]